MGEPEIRIGQIWRRHSVPAIHSLNGFCVRVESLAYGTGCIAVQGVIQNEDGEWVNAPKTRRTYLSSSSFKRGALTLVHCPASVQPKSKKEPQNV